MLLWVVIGGQTGGYASLHGTAKPPAERPGTTQDFP